MILAGKLPPHPRSVPDADAPDMYDRRGEVIFEIKVDRSNFQRQVSRAVRTTILLSVNLELIGLSSDGIRARFYTRGALDPDFADPAAFEQYARVLAQVPGDRGRTACEAFLRGWAERRGGTGPTVELQPWHRLLGDTAVSVGRAS